MTLEWIESRSSLSHEITVDSPTEMIMTFTGSARVQLTLLYNTEYNVSVIATHPCGETSVVTSIQLYYRK